MDALQARMTLAEQPNMEDSFENSVSVEVLEQLGKEISLAATLSCFFRNKLQDRVWLHHY